MEQTPNEFIDTLQQLTRTKIRETPEFKFIIAVTDQLVKNRWTKTDARKAAISQQIPLPAGATDEQINDMGFYFAELIAEAYNDLSIAAHYDDPLVEATTLAKQLLMRVLEQATLKRQALVRAIQRT